MKVIVVPASRWPGNGITRTPSGRRKKMKLAVDCIPCPDGCGEPWCSDCQMHYADCACPGPHSEEEDGAPQEEAAEAPAGGVLDVQAAEGRTGGEVASRLRSSEAPEGKTLTVKGVVVSDILVVTSKVKALVKAKDLRTSEEFIEKLSAEVQSMVEEAITRAVAAERKTLKADDLG
jgi:hypothetical protein